MAGNILRASEVGQYAYCARAWWLARVRGLSSANLAEMRLGTEQHLHHGRSVERSHRLRLLAVALLVLSLAFLIAWLVLSVGG